eukprot:186174_1
MSSSSEQNKKHNELELIVWYYVRSHYENKFNKINIPMPLKYLILNFSKYIIGSTLLTNKEDMNFVKLLSSKISNIKHFKLLFRASEHEYLASKFHGLCDGKAPTICIVKSNFGNIFGGYTSIGWKSLYRRTGAMDDKTFLFLIRSSNETQQKQCPVIYKSKCKGFSIVYFENYGPTFGIGHDLYISDKCDEYPKKLPYNDSSVYFEDGTYEYPDDHKPICGGNLKDAEIELYFFQVLEYEVFQLQ